MSSRKSEDDHVLEAIFNPELPAGGLEFDNGELDEVVEEEEDADTIEHVRHAKELEVEAVRKAEEGKLEDALQVLTEAILVAPDYPSPYNNRAQVYRLQSKVNLALDDLNTAVNLSCGRGTVAEQAYTQRGLIHRLHGKDDEARVDFTAAAKLGSKFAQKQLIQMNPYSALCGQMLTRAFDKLRKGEDT